jgi:hypothetical protein
MKLESKPAEQREQLEQRKAYHTPEMVVYGNIREITRNLGPKGAVDGGGGAAAGPKTGT